MLLRSIHDADTLHFTPQQGGNLSRTCCPYSRCLHFMGVMCAVEGNIDKLRSEADAADTRQLSQRALAWLRTSAAQE